MIHEELGSASRALLDAARDGLGPNAAAIARMRARIDAAVAGTAATTGTATAATTTSLATKLGIVGITLALVAGALLYARRDRALAPPAVTHLDTAEHAPVRVPPVHDTAREQVPELEMPVLVVAQPPRAAPPTPVAPAAKPAADLGREVELIDRAMAAMRAGDPRAALAAVRMHARETAAAGQLAEDAAAIEIEALCRLRDPAFASRLAAFDARWPDSAQRSRLPQSCP